jgi:pyrimidine deaminase RibD-like protein
MGIDLAIRLARRNQRYQRWPLGAVITKGGSVVAVGQSALKSPPLHPGCSRHAEEQALRRVRGLAPGCVMFVARKMRNGQIGLAKPCQHCQTLIRASGIKRVVYTVDDQTIGVWKP